MLGLIATPAFRYAAGVVGLVLALGLRPAVAQAPLSPGEPRAAARSEMQAGVHIGVATCSGGNCHGATERPHGSAVTGNEYIIWSTRDKHRNAYRVLLEERSIRMARALGLPDAANAKLCLDCHADNAPPDRRGRQFQLSDGVGCEACHGGASGWLGTHISGATHQQNINAGLYPTENPRMRAEKCLSCHFGDATKFVDHRLMGAGHPRLGFELDTFTAIQPAHFAVDQSYVQRKGRITDMQVWAAGQAIALIKRMDALLDPKHSRRGPFPEFVLFDCQSCHHAYDPLHAPHPTATGLGPGTVKLNDANAVMLRVIAARVAPAAAKALNMHMLALHRATTEDWAAIQREAAAVRQAAEALEPALSRHNFTREDMLAMAEAVISIGSPSADSQFSHAEQVTMSLQAIAAAMKSAGYLSEAQAQAATTALNSLNASFANEGTLRPDAFVKGLREMQLALGVQAGRVGQ